MRMRSPRRRNGTSLVEVPLTLWVFIFLMMMPLIDFVGLMSRCVCAYFGVRDATYQAAIQNSFTNAMSTANGMLGKDASAWTGIGYSGTNVYVVQVDSSGNVNPGTANSPWPSSPGINSKDVYLIRVTTSASVQPFMNLGGVAGWVNVPGISAPITMNYSYQVDAENPTGLTK